MISSALDCEHSGTLTAKVVDATPMVRTLRVAAKIEEHPDVPGVVKLNSFLVELWKDAELEAGCPLTVDGKPRRSRVRFPRGAEVPHLFVRRTLSTPPRRLDSVIIRDYVRTPEVRSERVKP
jgi:hypothetical protein